MHSIPLKGWLVLAVCALCPAVVYAVVITGFTFWSGPWMTEFQVSRSEAVVGYALGGGVLTLAGPLVGRAMEKISIRMVATLGGLTMAAGIAMAAFAPTFAVVLVLFATIIPIGGAFFGQISAQTLATRMFPHHTGLVNGVVIAGMALSGVLAALFAPALVAATGWRNTFLIYAGVIALVLAPVVWVLYNDPAGEPPKVVAEAGAAPSPEAGFGVLRTTAFWLILASVLPINFALSAIPPMSVDIARDAGLDVKVGALFVTVFSIAGAVGSLAGGWLCDRVGLRPVYAGIAIMFLAALCLFALEPGVVLLTVAMALAGMAPAVLPWMAANVALRFGPVAFGRVVGLLGAFFIPCIFYPILVAWIRDETGSYRPAYILSAAIVMLGLTTLLAMRPSRRAQVAASA